MEKFYRTIGLNGLFALVMSMSACGGGGTGSAGTPVPAPPPTGIAPAPAPASGTAPMIGSCEVFPATAIFNTRIDDVARFPTHANNTAWINSVGASVRFHADWSVGTDPTQYQTDYFGIPFNIVDGTAATTQWPLVSFDFTPSGTIAATGSDDESDCAAPSGSDFAISPNCSALPANQRHFPFPLDSNLLVESGTCNDPTSCGDHHVLMVEQGSCRLWESYFAYKLSGQWYALSTAAWDLKSLALRPSTWTSADAAGLPITPLLARAAEASSGQVNHALRVTMQGSKLDPSFVWPARHQAGGTAGGIPYGALLRLNANFVIPANWTVQAQALATAMKRYGLYVADRGSNFFVQGEPNAGWNSATITQLQTIPLGQMEFVDLSRITGDPQFSPNSMKASFP